MSLLQLLAYRRDTSLCRDLTSTHAATPSPAGSSPTPSIPIPPSHPVYVHSNSPLSITPPPIRLDQHSRDPCRLLSCSLSSFSLISESVKGEDRQPKQSPSAVPRLSSSNSQRTNERNTDRSDAAPCSMKLVKPWPTLPRARAPRKTRDRFSPFPPYVCSLFVF
ncbi:hypothetical protein BC835DRAFT_455663 [Cytidiella melzeri]|nr:hypothetical protein BC835DRAFT_455663 [Cytidiella melzeri]